MEGARTIAVIPSEHFHWRARVQFQESFRTRAEALNFAFEHGYNLIVESDDGRDVQYDVLLDPDGACTSGLDLESVETTDFLAEPEPISWTRLMVSTLINLARRFAAASARLYHRQVVPFYRHAAFVGKRRWHREVVPWLRSTASRWQWTDIERAIRRRWRTRPRWDAADLARRSAAFAALCLRQAGPVSRRAAAAADRCLREVVPLSRRFAAFVSSLQYRDVEPIYRHAKAVAGVWLRHAAARIRYAASRRGRLEIQAAIHRVCNRHFHWDALGFDHKVDAAVAGWYHREIVPAGRRATAAAETWLQEVGPRVREAASQPEWLGAETALHRHR